NEKDGSNLHSSQVSIIETFSNISKTKFFNLQQYAFQILSRPEFRDHFAQVVNKCFEEDKELKFIELLQLLFPKEKEITIEKIYVTFKLLKESHCFMEKNGLFKAITKLLNDKKQIKEFINEINEDIIEEKHLPYIDLLKLYFH